MIMPMHKRESLIYTVLMCFTMVLWMSMYNVALHMGTLNMEVIREGWHMYAQCVWIGFWYLKLQRDLHFVFW